MAFPGAHDCHVGRCLGKAWKGVAHPLHSVRAGKNGLNSLADDLRADVACGRSALLLVDEDHVRIRVLVLELRLLKLLLHQGLDLARVR